MLFDFSKYVFVVVLHRGQEGDLVQGKWPPQTKCPRPGRSREGRRTREVSKTRENPGDTSKFFLKQG